MLPAASRALPSPAMPRCPVEAVREELRCMLAHPAIAVERRHNAEPYLAQCLDIGRLLRWQQLILQECALWEDEMLAAEQAGEMKTGSGGNS